ncbi:MAG: GNAT family N-acetyltransferase [Candidatus Thiodiazotropha sp. (ex Lucinoma borealis)]|nr:GNAT family N-acetyltransferase [Candidatus Thiodiazotropha sp. (ex Lucinoma borealis)]
MAEVIELKTNRLKLRQWKESDLLPFAKMNADPAVMEYYPSILSEDESNEMAKILKGYISDRCWGFWAVEIIEEKKFIGFVGLHKPTYDLPVKNCVEVGWRLGREYWGKGYATEAAKESLRFAFEELDLTEVYSFASVSNKKSWSVMERINMVNTGNNFEHPIIPEGHHLREHVLYKITKKQWNNNYV